jgi:hypothetical protein
MANQDTSPRSELHTMLKYFVKIFERRKFRQLVCFEQATTTNILAQEEKIAASSSIDSVWLISNKESSIDSASCFLSIVRTAVQFAFLLSLAVAVTFFFLEADGIAACSKYPREKIEFAHTKCNVRQGERVGDVDDDG